MDDELSFLTEQKQKIIKSIQNGNRELKQIDGEMERNRKRFENVVADINARYHALSNANDAIFLLSK